MRLRRPVVQPPAAGGPPPELAERCRPSDWLTSVEVAELSPGDAAIRGWVRWARARSVWLSENRIPAGQESDVIPFRGPEVEA